MTDLWPRVEELLRTVERPARYLNHEWGSVNKQDADFHFCMVYPDTYELGQANQAVRILVNAVNAQPGMEAQRAFVPAVDMCDAMREHRVPLFALESCAPVAEFDVIGITLPHELAATNVLELLDLAGIAVRASDRDEFDPIVIGGGPCSYNPEPYALFFDAFSIGEGEEALPLLLQRIRECKEAGASRAEILRAIAQLPGVYVPSLYAWRSFDAEDRLVDRAPCARCADGDHEEPVRRLFREQRLGAVRGFLCGGGARPSQRGGTARLRSRMPFLPSRYDVSSRSRAQRGERGRIGSARLAADGIRRGEPHLALDD